ncbi:hypothetical protein BDN72DRAFT_958861 [Pluteus cervinus]|uniref:Uncharacterized protein n=1 Tax=Pluteus cervinus TaxID=181527 RepID=A0ACD3AXB8_9AGAR|nr:hypothetical protein BDN72DRAFT_958861 [Pluteus cervinus]
MQLTTLARIATALIFASFAIPLAYADVPLEFDGLWEECRNAGSTTYVGVRYENDIGGTRDRIFNESDCFPFEDPEHGFGRALAAVFCRSGICSEFAGLDCNASDVLNTTLIHQNTTWFTEEDWAEQPGHSLSCSLALSDEDGF